MLLPILTEGQVPSAANLYPLLKQTETMRQAELTRKSTGTSSSSFISPTLHSLSIVDKSKLAG